MKTFRSQLFGFGIYCCAFFVFFNKIFSSQFCGSFFFSEYYEEESNTLLVGFSQFFAAIPGCDPKQLLMSSVENNLHVIRLTNIASKEIFLSIYFSIPNSGTISLCLSTSLHAFNARNLKQFYTYPLAPFFFLLNDYENSSEIYSNFNIQQATTFYQKSRQHEIIELGSMKIVNPLVNATATQNQLMTSAYSFCYRIKIDNIDIKEAALLLLRCPKQFHSKFSEYFNFSFFPRLYFSSEKSFWDALRSRNIHDAFPYDQHKFCRPFIENILKRKAK